MNSRAVVHQHDFNTLHGAFCGGLLFCACCCWMHQSIPAIPQGRLVATVSAGTTDVSHVPLLLLLLPGAGAG
jgi:hypothetical protein